MADFPALEHNEVHSIDGRFRVGEGDNPDCAGGSNGRLSHQEPRQPTGEPAAGMNCGIAIHTSSSQVDCRAWCGLDPAISWPCPVACRESDRRGSRHRPARRRSGESHARSCARWACGSNRASAPEDQARQSGQGGYAREPLLKSSGRTLSRPPRGTRHDREVLRPVQYR